VSDAHTSEATHLTGGEVPAERVIEFINSHFATLRQPRRRIEVVSAAAAVL